VVAISDAPPSGASGGADAANVAPLVGTALDTTTIVGAAPTAPHRHHCWRRVVGGVIWLVVLLYVLWLATRVVRAVERFVDKYQGQA
jgi:hypothetical protein